MCRYVDAMALDPAEMREMLANYYAMIEDLDWNLGRVMEALEALPRHGPDRAGQRPRRAGLPSRDVDG